MNKAGWKCLWVLMLLTGMAGCAAQPLSPPPAFEAEPIPAGLWTHKADHLIFILDASSSMLEGHGGVEKFALARQVVANFNQTMPELPVQAAVRSFGHDSAVTPASTMGLYGPAAYARGAVADSLAKVKLAGGPSPLDRALAGTAADLKGAQGRIALVIVSDGQDMGPSVLEAAGALKSQFSDRLCIYTVQVGSDPAGHALLTRLAALTGCGAKLDTDAVAGGKGMAAFVKQVLLAELVDSDGDGVPDVDDRCPGTPAGTPVGADGCPPAVKPQPVKKVVVPDKMTWAFKEVRFENNSAQLVAASYPVLDEIVAALKAQTDLRGEIQGHTDSRGSQALNQALSERRANAVLSYLVSKGIAAERLAARGYGPDQPIASNATAEGRAENRRVAFKPVP
jgi:OmpA-OmpF porin, OOP family